MAIVTNAISATDLAKRAADKPALIGRNILDLAYTTAIANLVANTVGTLAAGDASAAAPNGIDKVQNRFLHTLWKFGSSVTATYIPIDQGAAPVDVDCLWIPAGHNLVGATIKVEADSTTPSGDPWGTTIWTFTAGAGAEMRFLSPNSINARYWRIKISAAGAFIPQAPQIFLGKAVQLMNKSNRPWVPTQAGMGGTIIVKTGGGVASLNRTQGLLQQRPQSFTIAGAPKTTPVTDPEILLANLLDLWSNANALNGGARPFLYVEDPTSNPAGAKLVYPVTAAFDITVRGPFETIWILHTAEQGAG